MSRRARGEGTITQRADGRWMARMDAGYNGEGTRQRKAVYGATKREVVDKLRELIREREQGTLAAGRTPTVGQFLEQWLTAVEPSVRYATLERYSGLCRTHLIPGLGRTRLDRLTPADVEAFCARKLSEGLSQRSVHHLRAVLRTALNRALRWGMVTRNVAALAEPIRVESRPYQVLDPQQARAFLDAVRGDRLEALYTVALALGLRQGEALGLRWQDVDLERGRLTVAYALQRQKTDPGEPAKPVLVEPKTERSRRTLALPATVLSALREHRSRQLQERLIAGSAWEEYGFIFTTTTGRPLLNTYLLRLFHAHLERAGLPRMRFHELRHSAASLLIAQGVPLKTVSTVLGHSTITLTSDVYGHLFQDAQREAANAMDRALGGVRPS